MSIFPIFPCADATRPLPAHPALIDAYVLGAGFIDVCFWASEPELTKVFFRSSDWSSHSQPKMAELSLQGVASVQELCARLRAALGRGALAEGLALSIEYEDCMGEMAQLTHGAEVDVLVGARSLYVTTKRAKSLRPNTMAGTSDSSTRNLTSRRIDTVSYTHLTLPTKA